MHYAKENLFKCMYIFANSAANKSNGELEILGMY